MVLGPSILPRVRMGSVVASVRLQLRAMVDLVSARCWRHHDRDTTSWHGEASVGRLRVGFHAYCHVSPVSSDRWVLQPFVVYDRACRAANSHG